MSVPLWRIEIHKELPAANWANDYLTDDVTIEDAQDLAALLLSWEKAIHKNAINFSYIRISSYVKGDRFFRHLTINEPGDVFPVDSLPYFNTLRIDFQTAHSDPSRKYYRQPVGEGDQTNGVFSTTFTSGIAALITSKLETPGVLDHLVTPAGNKVGSAVVYPFVQMRQLHRRRRKKVPTTP